MAPHPTSEPETMLHLDDVAFGSMRDASRVMAENVNWTAARGDFWVVGGLHGAGKSDFLMLLGGLMSPTRGRYWFQGEPMPIFDEARLGTRLKIGLVFETGQLFNQLTVLENVALPVAYHHNLSPPQARDRAAGLLENLELSAWAESTPGALSRNLQKRAGLARALILKPELLLLDNPLSGLDLRQLQWWLKLLCDLADGHPLLDSKPLTMVASASDLGPWRACARQCAILRKGSFTVLKDWPGTEAAGNELLNELIAKT